MAAKKLSQGGLFSELMGTAMADADEAAERQLILEEDERS
jgi:hypothetical protein